MLSRFNQFLKRSEAVGTIVVRPFQDFSRLEASGGILMILATIAALLWINSPWGDLYQRLWHTHSAIGLAGKTFDRTLHFWINEGLMTVFFFVVGLEIKREVLVGELTSLRRAAFPASAAVGGVIVPAVIYFLFNAGTPSERGWGIPMATDIAFVMTALTILGTRIPPSLGVFLVSLAIVDDLCAVVVVAAAYSTKIYFGYLGIAFLLLLILMILNVLGTKSPLPYALVGCVIWVFVYLSGIHATVTGVLVALTIPCRSDFDTHRFSESVREAIARFSPQKERGFVYELHDDNQSVVRALETACHRVEPPLQRLEDSLHPWVAFLIVPLFALANAGVMLDPALLKHSLTSMQALGIGVGLFVGKQVGIVSASWLAVRIGFAEMPSGLTFKHVYGGAMLCGIGFTMSLFIGELSLPAPELLNSAKITILAASALSGLAGMSALHYLTRSASQPLGE